MNGRETNRPQIWAAVAATISVLLVYVALRLYWFGDRSIPLTYALPMLLGLWHKNRRLHYITAAIYVALAAVQVFLFLPDDSVPIPKPLSYFMMLINISTVGIVTDMWLVSRRRLAAANEQLQATVASLESSNRQLEAGEHQIRTQNEELQKRTVELQSKIQESSQQAGALADLTDELRRTNEESLRRERLLQTLLRISASRSNDERANSPDQICEAAVQAFQGLAGAYLVTRQGNAIEIQGASGTVGGLKSRDRREQYHDPFAILVMNENRLAAIEDLLDTPEVSVPPHDLSHFFRSALAAPIRDDSEVYGALVVYSDQVRRWTEPDFQVIEWLAAQASLVLLAVRLQDELNDKVHQFDDAARRKARLLSAISHDVRTPANAISLMADVLKQAGQNPELVREIPQLAEGLRTNAKLLVEFVNDVIELTRFDSSRIDLDESEFEIGEVIKAAVKQYESVAEEAELRLTAVPLDVPVWIYTDRGKLTRVLGNLINNAIKFTPRGSVEVRGNLVANGFEIQVIDTGVGIHEHELEHIFDEFYQIHNPERDRTKGTGLGLAVCKRIVEAIECTLSIASNFGQGSTFTILVPRGKLKFTGTDATHVIEEHSENRLAGLRALVVEDHDTTRAALTMLLATHGANVDQVADGNSALKVLQERPPDVLLLDLMLPDIDGSEVLRYLRSQRLQLPCLLVVSGDLSEQRSKEVIELGADDVVLKPIELDDLIDRIGIVLRTNQIDMKQERFEDV